MPSDRLWRELVSERGYWRNSDLIEVRSNGSNRIACNGIVLKSTYSESTDIIISCWGIFLDLNVYAFLLKHISCKNSSITLTRSWLFLDCLGPDVVQKRVGNSFGAGSNRRLYLDFFFFCSRCAPPAINASPHMHCSL